MQALIQQFKSFIIQVPVHIKQVAVAELEAKPDPKKWSKKEILGHLIDSAIHNLQRFTYAQFQRIEIKPYPQAALVSMNRYQEQSLQELIDLWVSLNRQIACVIDGLTEEQFAIELEATDDTGGEKLTLAWLIEDYIVHLEHHLKQVFEGNWPLEQEKQATRLAVSLAEASQLLEKAPKPFITLFRHRSMSVELYHPNQADLQQPHEQDELYVVIQGTGKFELEGKVQAIQAHDVLFAPAGYQHRFVDFSDDFQTWVIFYGPKGGEKEPTWSVNRACYELTDDADRLDLKYIHQFLSQSYWAQGREFQTVKKSITHSHCFGLFDGERQLGFSRVITDYSTFAYLADVFVDEADRGKGLGKWMVEQLVNAPVFKSCKWLLKTNDAQSLYAQLGFHQVTGLPEVMERS